MSNPLHKKLKKALGNYRNAITDTSGDAWMQEERIEDAIKQIEQAFEADGYVKIPQSYEKDNVLYVNGADKILRFDGTKTVTETLMSESQWQKNATEEGWKSPESTKKVQELVNEIANVGIQSATMPSLTIIPNNYMTGQEWHRRFVDELGKPTYMDEDGERWAVYKQMWVGAAAKRAAGLEDNNNYDKHDTRPIKERLS